MYETTRAESGGLNTGTLASGGALVSSFIHARNPLGETHGQH
jgi:hypothetical protein